jgi:regulatory protein
VPRKSSKGASDKPRGTPLETGVRLLARRPHSRAELFRKLRRRGFAADDSESALGALDELGYIDDATFAEGYVRRRSASRGPLALSAELAARGVGRELAGEAIGRLDRDAQVLAAAVLVRRATGRKLPASYQELLDSAGAKLLRRGFSPAIAWAACRAVWDGTWETLHLGPPPSV